MYVHIDSVQPYNFQITQNRMSLITIDSIVFKNNPAMFSDPINVQITFTALAPLQSPLSWKVIYVGSAISEEYDQVLEEFQIGPFEEASTMKFDVECLPPDYKKIPQNELLCVTALIFTVSYKDQQFTRVGYYVHNQFLGETEVQKENYPALPIVIASTKRTILSDKPRITNFSIKWQSKQKNKQSCEDKEGNKNSKLSSQMSNNFSLDYYFNEIKNGKNQKKCNGQGNYENSLSIHDRISTEQCNIEDNNKPVCL